MSRLTNEERTSTQLPGPLWPDRCLECPEMLREDYGGRRGRCAECMIAAAERNETSDDFPPR